MQKTLKKLVDSNDHPLYSLGRLIARLSPCLREFALTLIMQKTNLADNIIILPVIFSSPLDCLFVSLMRQKRSYYWGFGMGLFCWVVFFGWVFFWVGAFLLCWEFFGLGLLCWVGKFWDGAFFLGWGFLLGLTFGLGFFVTIAGGLLLGKHHGIGV